MAAADDDRLVSIETQLAHQGQVLDDLSAILAKQWSLLERLEQRLERMEARLQDAEGALADSAASEPPPPHY